MKELITEFEIASANIVKQFIKNIFGENVEKYTTQSIIELFVGNDITDIMEYNDYYVNFSDIYLAVKHNISDVEFLKWYDYNLKWSTLDEHHQINLFSWINNCPRRSHTEYVNASAKFQKLQNIKLEFEQYIDSLNEIK